MATYSSILARRIPRTGKAGGLPSHGVTQSRMRLKRLSCSSSSSRIFRPHNKSKQVMKLIRLIDLDGDLS